MNVIEHLELCAARIAGALERIGTVSIADSADTRPVRSLYIAVQGPVRFAGIILWETGEAEWGSVL